MLSDVTTSRQARITLTGAAVQKRRPSPGIGLEDDDEAFNLSFVGCAHHDEEIPDDGCGTPTRLAAGAGVPHLRAS